MSRRSPRWVRRAEAVAALALVAAVVVLVTRSTPTKASHADSTATTSSAPPPVSNAPPTSAPAAPAASGQLPQLQQKASSATNTIFKATYEAKSANSTIVFAQKGAKTAFLTGTTSYYSEGASSIVCDSSSGVPLCYTGAKPLGGLLSLIDPARESSAIRAAAAAGSPVSYSEENHDGQLSSCISYANAGQHVKYCINDQGILTYIRIPAGAFELTAYTTNVSDADVSVPANATLQSAPSTP